MFKDAAKGNCVACHAPPNFTDNGYHNIGIAHAKGDEDLGRFKIRAAAVLKGAFKTPTLRDIELTATVLPQRHRGHADATWWTTTRAAATTAATCRQTCASSS